MNGYKRYEIMKSHDISFEEDFIIGLVYEERVIGVMDIIEKCIEAGLCSYATAHKYCKMISQKGYVTVATTTDQRAKRMIISSKGIAYLEELK